MGLPSFPALCTLAAFWTAQLAVHRLISRLWEEAEAERREGSGDVEASEYVWASSWLRAEHESGLLYTGNVFAWRDAGGSEFATGEEDSGERHRLVYKDSVSSAPNGNYGSMGGGEVERQDLSKLEHVRPAKEEEKNECSICLCGYKPGERVVRLPCGHIFHASCVGEWMRGRCRNRCPLCNFDLGLNEYPLPK